VAGRARRGAARRGRAGAALSRGVRSGDGDGRRALLRRHGGERAGVARGDGGRADDRRMRRARGSRRARRGRARPPGEAPRRRTRVAAPPPAAVGVDADGPRRQELDRPRRGGAPGRVAQGGLRRRRGPRPRAHRLRPLSRWSARKHAAEARREADALAAHLGLEGADVAIEG
jgi:hypothetical protein